MNTKDKILKASKALFNEKGFGAPSLNQLAQLVGISRGNLTYYFKDKESLLESLAGEMWEKYEHNIGRAMQFPSWESTHNSTQVYFELQKEYRFIFFDLHVSSHAMIINQLQRVKKDMFKRQLATIAFSIEIGNMYPERIPGTYHNLCEALWMINFYWLSSETYRSLAEKDNWSKLIWSTILPHFTDKGIASFIAHFGESYYDTLGEKFSQDKYQNIGF